MYYGKNQYEAQICSKRDLKEVQDLSQTDNTLISIYQGTTQET